MATRPCELVCCPIRKGSLRCSRNFCKKKRQRENFRLHKMNNVRNKKDHHHHHKRTHGRWMLSLSQAVLKYSPYDKKCLGLGATAADLWTCDQSARKSHRPLLRGLYEAQINRWLRTFGKEQVKLPYGNWRCCRVPLVSIVPTHRFCWREIVPCAVLIRGYTSTLSLSYTPLLPICVVRLISVPNLPFEYLTIPIKLVFFLYCGTQ